MSKDNGNNNCPEKLRYGLSFPFSPSHFAGNPRDVEEGVGGDGYEERVISRVAAMLSKIPPHFLLAKIFKTLGCFIRASGIFPIEVHSDGTASFTLWGRRMIHTFVYFLVVAATAYIYYPQATLQANLHSDNPASVVVENLFMWSQYAAVVLNILLIPRFSRLIVPIWNGTREVVEFVATRNQSHLYWAPYIATRIAVFVHLIFVIVYGIVCWMDFASRIEPPEKWDSQTHYYLNGMVVTVFFIVCFFHHFPIMIYRVFAVVFEKSLIGLGILLGEHEKYPKMHDVEVKQIIKVYEKIQDLTKGLGDAMGHYFLLELVVIMCALVTSAFSISTCFKQRDLYSTMLTLLMYVFVLILISETGEQLQNRGNECLDQIRNVLYGLPQTSVEPALLQKMSTIKEIKMSAAGYFTLNRALLVAMASSFATYGVVIVQFQLSSSDVNKNTNCSPVYNDNDTTVPDIPSILQ